MSKIEMIRAAAKSEVGNVKSLIRDLVKKKIARAEEDEAAQKEAAGNTSATASKSDFGAFYNKMLETISTIQTEMQTAPSSETVRAVRTLLTEAKNIFPLITTGEIQTVLQALYELAAAVMVRASWAGDTKAGAKKGDYYLAVNDNSKGYESRKLARVLLLKFVHENAIKYLGKDMYPLTAKEASKELTTIAKQQISDVKKSVADREDSKAEKEEKNALASALAKESAERQKFFQGFASQEDIIYAIAPILYNMKQQALSYTEVINKIKHDTEYATEGLELLYGYAKEHDYTAANFQDWIHMTRGFVKEETVAQGKALFLKQIPKQDLELILIAIAINTEPEDATLDELRRAITTNIDYRTALEDELYRDSVVNKKDPQYYIKKYVPAVSKLIAEEADLIQAQAQVAKRKTLGPDGEMGQVYNEIAPDDRPRPAGAAAARAPDEEDDEEEEEEEEEEAAPVLNRQAMIQRVVALPGYNSKKFTAKYGKQVNHLTSPELSTILKDNSDGFNFD